MFLPERMVRVEISIPKESLYETIEAIGESGLLHIDTETEGPLFHELGQRAGKLLEKIEGYLQTLGIESFETAAEGPESDYERFLAAAERFVSAVAPKIESLANRKKAVEEELSLLERADEFAEALDSEIDCREIFGSLKYIGSKALVLAKESVEMFMISVKRYDPFAVYAPLASGSVAMLLLYESQDEEHMANAIAKMEGSEVAADYFAEAKREETKALKRRLDMEFESAAKRYGKELYIFYVKLKRAVEIFSVKSALQRAGEYYLLYGWVPKREAGRFADALKSADVAFFEAKDDAPVLLDTPRVLKPFEVMIKSFSYPGYNEINPTIPFAFAFVIMFGAMFGDIGHGIVLMAVGLFVSKMYEKYADLGKVYILAGVGSAIFGLFYGSFFGFHDLVPHLLFVPVENVDLSIFTGVVIVIFFITIGFLLNIFSLARRKRISALFIGEGGVLWLLIYWFAIGIAVKALIFELPVKHELYLLGALVLVLLVILLVKKREYAQTLLDALIQMFEQAVNTVSFARLGAFALAHGALFLALFSIADILSKADSKGIGYWFIIVLGNCFIIVLEGVVVTIQTLRLEYYEFFKHFFKGGGTPYKPFRLESRV